MGDEPHHLARLLLKSIYRDHPRLKDIQLATDVLPIAEKLQSEVIPLAPLGDKSMFSKRRQVPVDSALSDVQPIDQFGDSRTVELTN